MKYWKLGCNWGSKDDVPDFYPLVKKFGIIVCHSKPHKRWHTGDYVLLSEFLNKYTIVAIAKLLGEEIVATKIPELKSEFDKYCITDLGNVYVAKVKIMPLSEDEQFDDPVPRMGRCELDGEAYGYDKIINKLEGKEMTINITELLKKEHNVILTGAPGTGKTYLARQVAASLIGCSIDELDSSDQFEFVQFHPSYDYSDFVEGLRPVEDNSKESIGFTRKDGIFFKFCERALNSKSNTFAAVYNSLIKDIREAENEGSPYTVILRNRGDSQPLTVTENDNIKWSKPSDGKPTVNTVSKNRLNKLFNRFPTLKEFDGIKNITTEINDVIGGCDASYYWAILKEILYRINNNPSDKNYVFVIDEINRGELSKIFGELFFSIDPGYRGKRGAVLTKFANLRKNPNSFDLALNKNEYGHFFVPKNVYILGTMNDIDRSVESMDFAMRRRFAWVEVEADKTMNMLDTLKEKNVSDEKIAEIKEHMRKLNEAILDIPGLGKEYQIGAAYFLKYPDYKYFDELWDKHLSGLLYEYLRGSRNASKDLKNLKDAYDKATVKQEEVAESPSSESNDEKTEDPDDSQSAISSSEVPNSEE